MSKTALLALQVAESKRRAQWWRSQAEPEFAERYEQEIVALQKQGLCLAKSR
jgi:hypothetical protein